MMRSIQHYRKKLTGGANALCYALFVKCLLAFILTRGRQYCPIPFTWKICYAQDYNPEL